MMKKVSNFIFSKIQLKTKLMKIKKPTYLRCHYPAFISLILPTVRPNLITGVYNKFTTINNKRCIQ